MPLLRIILRPFLVSKKANVGKNEGQLMRYKLGRLLQLIGLVVLPVAVSGNLANALTLGQSLTLSFIGLVVFYIGRYVQGDAGA
jgi:hypothetical protein